MADPLTQIKRLILLGDYRFTLKARLEMEEESITELEVTRPSSTHAGSTRSSGARIPRRA